MGERPATAAGLPSSACPLVGDRHISARVASGGDSVLCSVPRCLSEAANTIESMVSASLMNHAQQLDGAEKLELIHTLWDSIDHSARKASDSAFALVRRRAAEADADPHDEVSSSQFWADIARRSA